MKSIVLTIAISIFLFINVLNAQVLVRTKPVSPRVKTINAKRPSTNYIWVDSHWKWDKKIQRYKWISGKWVKQRRGYAWVAGNWIDKPNGFIWKEGYWKRKKS